MLIIYCHRRHSIVSFGANGFDLIGVWLQVVCDILRSGGLPGKKNGHQPPLFFAADDLEYQVGLVLVPGMPISNEFSPTGL